VDGGGIRQLREAGLEVISGVLREEARQQNRAFLHRVRTGRPFGILKWAMSLDGRTALPNGASQWISGPPARDWVHRLRSGMDAVIVGGGTVRADNPLLTSRGRRSPEPLRVVLSRSLDLPDQAQLWDTAIAPTLVAHGPDADPERLPGGPEGVSLSHCEPLPLMETLAERGCNQVLWECGPELAAAAIRQGCVQEISAVVAPKLMGGRAARTPLADLDFSSMDQALQGRWHQCEPLGHDWLLRWRSGS
jgi:diaminohydroxyphosphoribosylaminopyrimidine deaminase/5-amino-6-(5-phosphoribosylamino)uracil reductase